jgi:hypothetical protein
MNDSGHSRLRSVLSCSAPALGFFVVSLIGLDRIPYFGGDEAYPASTAWTFVSQGRFAREITAGSLGTNVFDAYPPLWILLLSGVYKVFDAGIWTTRVPSIAAAALTIALLSYAVRTLTGSNLRATFAGVVYAFDPLLLQRARIGRMEPLAVLFVCAGICATCARGRRWWWFAGLCFACAVASYQFAALAAAAWLLGLLAARELRRACFVALGGATGVALWTVWAWGHWDQFRAQVLDTGQAYTEPVLLAVVHEWQRYFNLHAALHAPTAIPFYALAPLLAAFACVRSKLPLERAVCVACIAEIVLFAFVGMKSSAFYFMFATPFVVLVLSMSIDATARWTRRLSFALAACSVLGGALVLGGLGYRLAKEWSCRDPYRFDTAVGPVLERAISAGKTVVGPNALWLPTIRRGGVHRVIFDDQGAQTESLLRGFADDGAALAAAGVIAFDDGAETLIRRYPALQRELTSRTKTLDLTAGCNPSTFGVTFYERTAGDALHTSE